jgi:putative PIN family toxin of toxin-antitoxin system
MIRAVVDTNVLVSALLSPAGNEALILLAIQHGMIEPCFSADIMAEYLAVLRRPRFAFGPDELESVHRLFQEKGLCVEPDASSAAFTSPDPADTKFLRCALTINAPFIITGNKRDFPDAPYGETQVVNAAELIDQITGDL